MSKKLPTMGELVSRPVIRQLIDSEWMSKMSSKEFREWEKAERDVMEICGHPEYEHDAKLQQQIEFKELEYKLRKEQIEKENKIIRDGADGLMVADNDISLGGELSPDLVLNPGVAGAVLRRDKYVPVTASTKTFHTRYGKVRGLDTTPYVDYVPKVFRNDKYEKHVKKYGI